MTRLATYLLMGAGLAIGGGAAQSQQELVIDFDAGRTIINDPWRAILWRAAIDHERGIFYVRDSEEPEGILAFSLLTGERVQTFLAPTGDGPKELPEGVRSVSVAPDGRVYIAGMVRVVEYTQQGEYLGAWTPNAPARRDGSVCDFGGQPAVPVVGGVLRRGDDGSADMGIGSNVLMLGSDPDEWIEMEGITDRVWNVGAARILCTPDAAFVVLEHSDKTDSLFVYYRASNREGRLPIPTELAADQALTVGPLLETDGRGHVVLLGVSFITLLDRPGGFTAVGAVLDPATGCHGVIRNPEPNMLQPTFQGIYQDSALVAYRYREEGRENGRLVRTTHTYSNRVALHPLRRISGQPCPGMLPTVN
ncbi:MAG: hypothetical protein F4107_12300 [Gemmatimonadetes bacterium]|nr:hypothetical protein [Gemmatimonadota bacterium]MYD13384.1 hypothetical protein [Gemmatimonadota bacterium]MYI66693.1 hypothetical protein [Gemmatimonadota bacterium]